MSDADTSIPAARSLARRRQKNVGGGRPASYRVRVSPDEQAQLVRLADEQAVTVPRLLVESALSGAGETPSARRMALAELFALRRPVATIANNVNQVATRANSTGVLVPQTQAVLEAARGVLAQIDEQIAQIERLGRP